MSNLLVSIIIVNYNGKKLLQQCLESLNFVDYSPLEIILVDNGSNDDTVEFVSNTYPHVIILKLDENQGYAEPNNLGSNIAKGDFLLFLNNDTIVTPTFITELVNVIQNNHKIAICQSLLLKLDGSVDSSGDFIDKIGVVYNSKREVDVIKRISSARGASMIIRKDIFHKLGGFDKEFFVTFEDVDLGWRAWISGYESVIVPKSIVYHIGGETQKKFLEEISFHGFKNQIIMKLTNFEAHHALKRIFLFFIYYGYRETMIFLDYTFKNNTLITSTKYETRIAPKPNFRIIARSIFWILKNPYYILKKHASVNSSRVYSTKNLEDIGIISNNKN